jgi:hypothetical protein
LENEEMNGLKTWLSIVTTFAWLGFVVLDHHFQKLVEQAVRDRAGTYGELFGPLSFFRPAFLVLALALTAVALVLLASRRGPAPTEDG